MNLQVHAGSQAMPVQLTSVAKIGSENQPKPNPSMNGWIRSSKQLSQAESQGVKVSVGEEQLIKAIDRAIKALEGPATSFEMKVHEQTNAVIVKVFNKETGELIREIPPEKTLDLVVKMMEFAGILVDEKV